jgi:hypothetical protein
MEKLELFFRYKKEDNFQGCSNFYPGKEVYEFKGCLPQLLEHFNGRMVDTYV